MSRPYRGRPRSRDSRPRGRSGGLGFSGNRSSSFQRGAANPFPRPQKEKSSVDYFVDIFQKLLNVGNVEDVLETVLNLEERIIYVLNDDSKCDVIFSELFLKVILKASLENKLDSSFRQLLTKILGTGFATKDVDSLISTYLPMNPNVALFNLLISFLKLTFELVPGMAYDMYYFRVENLRILLEIPHFQAYVSEEAQLELQELLILTSSCAPEQKVVKKEKDEKGPPDDFRKISIFPTTSNLLSVQSKDVFLRKNKSEGAYASVDDYLDVQFRLMHEDFIQPLREGIKQYKTNSQERNFNVRVYRNVRLLNSVPNRRIGMVQYVQLDNCRLRRIKWSQSKRLIYGSLLCFSHDNFETLLFATVANRDDKDIKEGILAVKFMEEVPVNNQEYVLLETINMFESYRHVLAKLQETNETNLSMKDYLVFCKKDIRLPAYLTRDQIYSLSPLRSSRYTVRPGDTRSRWPSPSDLYMNESQFCAFKSALTKEMTIIQGPPGTGKTYVGLKICSCLLRNVRDSGPILVVCYTNHALDQFLEGISTFTDKIVRVGGQSKSKLIQPFSLQNQKEKLKKKERELEIFGIRNRFGTAKWMVHNTLTELEESLCILNDSYKSIISINRLNLFMSQGHYEYLKDFGIMQWLSGKCLSDFMSDFDDLAEIVVEEILYSEVQKTLEEIYILFINPSSVGVKDEDEEEEEEEDSDNEVRYLTNQRLLDTDSGTIAGLAYRLQRTLGLGSRREQNFTMGKTSVKSRWLKNSLAQTSIMPDDEVKNIGHLDDLSLENRWRLYQYWRFRYMSYTKRRTKIIENEYENNVRDLEGLNFLEDESVMKEQDVIGMTTTGAARYSLVLERIGCRIIIVEEAAEVLESHILGSLNSRCQHLILMGDHKQLRPNPAVYELTRKYGLDLSLFERMVNNDLYYNTLSVQHRMRPDIADVVRFIYPELQDSPNVTQYPDIPALRTNIFFFNHSNMEEVNQEIVSYTNKFEAELVVNLCRHLIHNGVQRANITILTLYSGQKFILESLMDRKKEFAEVRVCVVDNYQGEENDVILLSLVRSNDEERIGFAGIDNRICVSLSRAKHGLYVFGNFDLLTTKSKLWNKIRTFLVGMGRLGESLDMFCQNHPEKKLVICSPGDFNKYPDGGCELLCKALLKCGHICRRHCHFLDKDHEEYECMFECTRLCSRGHLCLLRCHQECKDCSVSVEKMIPQCGHLQLLPCYKEPKVEDCKNPCEKILQCGHRCTKECGESCDECQVKVSKTSPECGHVGEYMCSDQDMVCMLPCETMFPECGHLCRGTCGTCLQGRLHRGTCVQECGSSLICGHICESWCSAPCTPCTASCEEGCWHHKYCPCDHMCGKECRPCTDTCLWTCEHLSCTRGCKDSCDRGLCDRGCSKSLQCIQCHHTFKCYGICGERCRTICYKCDPSIKEGTKYITLWTCDHTFEVTMFDQYMFTQDQEGRIVRKMCIQCGKLINCASTFRYMNMLREILKRVKSVQRLLNKEIQSFNCNSYDKMIGGCKSNIMNLFKEYGVENYFFKDDEDDILPSKFYPLYFPSSNMVAYKYTTSVRLVRELIEGECRALINTSAFRKYNQTNMNNSITNLIKWLNPNNRKFDEFEVKEARTEIRRIEQLGVSVNYRPLITKLSSFLTKYTKKAPDYGQMDVYMKNKPWGSCSAGHVFLQELVSQDPCLTCSSF